MSSCNIDHSLEDVQQKLNDQKNHLPTGLYEKTASLLQTEPNQQILNDVFHALKKYDLASDDEKQSRNKTLEQLTNRQ
ncbi:group-specific protein [Texcoconibacillus texcoconensis]|uniref:Group-specific protein n=1 Tax=Texcoconibacillus texcoconensis TaxID=1095777 RepID=A0A840QRN5_9BACI|nr:group-specific protein [Texcoconibacillus texcoconensis]MBB5174024.1 hypothetical protein [Texcoconibacillus texcoconensis]